MNKHKNETVIYHDENGREVKLDQTEISSIKKLEEKINKLKEEENNEAEIQFLERKIKNIKTYFTKSCITWTCNHCKTKQTTEFNFPEDDNIICIECETLARIHTLWKNKGTIVEIKNNMRNKIDDSTWSRCRTCGTFLSTPVNKAEDAYCPYGCRPNM